ncbi:SixA phosphatase family protein [Mesobacterium pallidum]|uniref:SixA phosphatase family protein n=1 Tax=Mesobacterium pallidum TaxID=2872037 RepID=UPI001EE37601|nr:histidine phosphatase family protein [Mesobacterium pallidum]
MTKRLVLMRHAKSDWSMNLDDHARPLNPRGLRAGVALGDWLRAQGITPDQALVSDAIRTRETFAGLGLAVAPEYLRGLYLATPEQMRAVLSRATGDVVLMIGHNDGIGTLAAALVDEPPEHDRFYNYPTGSTLVVDFDIDDWADLGMKKGRAAHFITPRDLE